MYESDSDADPGHGCHKRPLSPSADVTPPHDDSDANSAVSPRARNESSSAPFPPPNANSPDELNQWKHRRIVAATASTARAKAAAAAYDPM